MDKPNCQEIANSPQRVLRLNGRERLFGRREYTGLIVLLFDSGGEEKMA
jgi:hypothetical protein